MTGHWLSCPQCQVFFLQSEHEPNSLLCPACRQSAPPSAQDPDDLEWFYIENRQKAGPSKLVQLRQRVANGTLRSTDMVLEKGTSKWMPAAEVPGLFPKETPASALPAAILLEPATPTPPAYAGRGIEAKGTAAPAAPVAAGTDVPEWFYTENQQKVGPVGLDRLGDLIVRGTIRVADMVLPKGTSKWVPVLSIQALFPSDDPVVEPPAPAAEQPDPPLVVASDAEPQTANTVLPPAPPVVTPLVLEKAAPPQVAAEEPPAVPQTHDADPVVPDSAPAPVAIALPEPIVVPPEIEPLPVATIPEPVPTPCEAIAAAPVATPAPVAVPAGNPQETIDRFEFAWWQGKRPELDDFLPTSPELRRAVLPAMTGIDLQCRLNCQEAVRLESYLERFPELADHREAVLELVALEYRLRQRNQADLPVEEYLQRFPQYRADLSSRLQAPSAVAAPTEDRPTAQDAQPVGSSASQPAAPPVDEPVVPDHDIRGILSQSSRSVVYEAQHLKLMRSVALKVFLAHDHASAEQRERFAKGAQAVAGLHHPSIVAIAEIGAQAARPYLSLELVPGGTLAKLLDGTPLPPRRSAELIEKLADALQYAHDKGVVHGDLVPAHVLLQKPLAGDHPDVDRLLADCCPKLTDFGVSQLRAELFDPSRPDSAACVGYLAPEQAARRPADVGPRTDIYALGAILYEMLAGRPPFKGATVRDTLEQVQSQEPVPPRLLQANVPLDLDTICLRCLEKSPQRRYGTAGELAQNLRRFLAGKPIDARSMRPAERLVQLAQANPRAAGLLAAMTLVMVVGFAMIHSNYRAARHARDVAENARALAVQDANGARTEKEEAQRHTAAVRAEIQLARASEQRARQREKLAQENEQQARENEQKALESEKKAQAETVRARLAAEQNTLAWHRQHAEQWEKAGQWIAAAYHLGRLIELAPMDDKLMVRRAHAYRQLGQWLPAAVDYSRALELKPDLPVQDDRDLCLGRSLPVQASSLIGKAAIDPLFWLPPFPW